MITRDIWNPWHGCTKVSEGCDHCYMYFLDRMRGQDGSRIRRSDVIFFLLTKRPERVPECLPPDWRQGWENITLYVTAGYVHTLEKTSKIKENRHSKPLKYAILYAKFFENP